MTEEELAALSVALDVLQPAETAKADHPRPSRWKLADRLPDLEMEELRALH